MSVLPVGIGADSAAGSYQIERSLRFNSADSAYLNRTPASAGNRKTWTWSGWVKRCNSATTNTLFAAYVDANNFCLIQFREDGDNGRFEAFNYSSAYDWRVNTIAVLRDPSAWYHIVVALDTTQATDSNRIKIYVNGTEQALTTITYPTQNFDSDINNNIAHSIGQDGGNGRYHNGYLTEVNFIDGSALDPTSFGEFNEDTGVWQPKAYSGSYGTNGFYLNFSDNSGVTSTTLGKDQAGSNNWTPNNFSVTAGAGNDSLVDTPTNYGEDTGVGGEVRGNYCTMNPLTTTEGTYTQGNLRYTAVAGWRRSNGTTAVSTGKWYWEVTLAGNPEGSGSTNAYQAFGFGVPTSFNSNVGPDTLTDALVLGDNNYYKNFSGSWTSNSTSFTSGDVLSVAVDLDANTFTFRKNNSQLVTGTIGGTAGRELVPIILSYNSSFGVMDCNFGQRPFAYTAPSGFKALCTQNLPEPTIVDGGEYFNTVLWTGDGTSSRSITGVGFQPDWAWIKKRNAAFDHNLFDAVRGAGKGLESSSTAAEFTVSDRLTAFGSDGFTVGNSSAVNNTSDTYVAWNWKANGSGVSNTAGTITSTVSANTDSGFSIVTYTGNGSSSATVGHGLGTTPSMVVVKKRSGTTNWFVKHASVPGTQQLLLNGTLAATNAGSFTNGGVGNLASTTFGFLIGVNDVNNCNENTATFVAYCFAAIPGYSAFGSYTGNGADGPFVFCGFRPRYVLIKNASATGDWFLYDTARNTYNVADSRLKPNLSDAEGTGGSFGPDILSNGFKMRSNFSELNGSGNTIIYAAFAENPFKYALAR